MAEKEGAGLDAGIKLSRGQGKAVLGLKGMAVWGRGEEDWRQQSARFQAFGGRLVWRDWVVRRRFRWGSDGDARGSNNEGIRE